MAGAALSEKINGFECKLLLSCELLKKTRNIKKGCIGFCKQFFNFFRRYGNMRMKLIVCAFLLLAVSINTQAVILSSSVDNIMDWANGTEVSTNGMLIDAVNCGNAETATTVNGVTFKGSYPGAYHEGRENFGNASFRYLEGDTWAWGGLLAIPGAYFTVGNSQLYGGRTGVINLKGGYIYELQIFVFDDRLSTNKTFNFDFYQASFSGELTDNGGSWDATDETSMGSVSIANLGGGGVTRGVVVTIQFTVGSGWNGLVIRPNSYDGFYSGMQLRELVSFDPFSGQQGVAIAKVLSWSAPSDPNLDPSYSLTYDVYMDPNEANVGTGSGCCSQVSLGQSDTMFDPIPDMEYLTTYYWRVDTHAKLDYLSEPNLFTGQVLSFTTEQENTAPAMDAGKSIVTWLEAVQAGLLLETPVLTDLEGDAVVAWMAEPRFPELPGTVSFDDATLTNPTVTISHTGIYKLTVTASDGVNSASTDSLRITVYADSCEAAKNNPNAAYVQNAFDLDNNCIVDLDDFSIFAQNWLDETSLADSQEYPLAVSGGSNVILWLDASNTDSLTIETNNTVSRWNDLSGHDCYLTPGGTAGNPAYIAAAVNGNAIIDFGAYYGDQSGQWGSGKWMQLKNAAGNDLNLNRIRTVFLVMKGNNFLLGDDGNYDFHRGGEAVTSEIWNPWYANGNILNGSTYLNGVKVNGTSAGLPETYSVISLVTTGNVEASRLACDRTNRSGGQQIAEVIIFDCVLNDAERQSIENYLSAKWGL